MFFPELRAYSTSTLQHLNTSVRVAWSATFFAFQEIAPDLVCQSFGAWRNIRSFSVCAGRTQLQHSNTSTLQHTIGGRLTATWDFSPQSRGDTEIFLGGPSR